MKTIIKATTLTLSVILASGCANVTPPPNRLAWDNVDPNTHCTTDESATNGQFIGSLILSGVGGWDIGAGLALGQFPIVGLGLATAGIMGGSDVDKKQQQIKECKEFKQYVMLKKSSPAVAESDKKPSVEQRLTQLKKMLEDKIINQEEYNKARKKVLADI